MQNVRPVRDSPGKNTRLRPIRRQGAGGTFPRNEHAPAAGEPARVGDREMVFDEAGREHAVAVDLDEVFAFASGDGAVSDGAETEARVLVPDVAERTGRLFAKGVDEFSGRGAAAVVGDEDFVRQAGLALHAFQDEAQCFRPIVGRNEQSAGHRFRRHKTGSAIFGISGGNASGKVRSRRASELYFLRGRG